MVYEEVKPLASVGDLEVTVTRKSLELRLMSASPGMFIFCFGAAGLILMVFKVPTKEVLGYKREGAGPSGMGLIRETKILDTRKTYIPLPIWWLIKRTQRFERVNENA